MTIDVEKAFALAQKPGITRGGTELGEDALVFTGGEILSLARFCYTKSKKQPVLITVCERGDNKGPYIYEGFKIGSLSVNPEDVSLHFHGNPRHGDPNFQLQLIPGKDKDPSGTVVTRIETLAEYFPRREYEAFRARFVAAPKAPKI